MEVDTNGMIKGNEKLTIDSLDIKLESRSENTDSIHLKTNGGIQMDITKSHTIVIDENNNETISGSRHLTVSNANKETYLNTHIIYVEESLILKHIIIIKQYL